MLRNEVVEFDAGMWVILNEVLSLNAQEFARRQHAALRNTGVLNEVLSLNAQEFPAHRFDAAGGQRSSMKS